jgi:hypothetical protein
MSPTMNTPPPNSVTTVTINFKKIALPRLKDITKMLQVTTPHNKRKLTLFNILCDSGKVTKLDDMNFTQKRRHKKNMRIQSSGRS